VEFKYNSADLTPRSEKLLKNVADIIKKHAEFSYAIQGHTDAHGNEDYNLKLSSARAQKVRSFLVDQGINGGSLTAEGFGSSQPIADNSTNEGRLQNRRVVIKIIE
jgi:outer membrane protein OmpA-like peptidoglycan-associated protein